MSTSTHPLRSISLSVALLCCTLLLAKGYYIIIHAYADIKVGIDLNHVYQWAQQWRLTGLAYLSPTHHTLGPSWTLDPNGNLYNPFFMILFSAITKPFSYPVIYTTWCLLSLGMFIAIILHATKTIFKPTSPISYLAIILFALAYYPVLINIAFGEMGLLLACILYLAELCLKKNKSITAGVLFGLLINIKLFFGFFIFYLLGTRNRPALISCILSTILLGAIPCIVTGNIQIYQHFLKTIGSVHWAGISWNASFYGFLCRLFGDMNQVHHSIMNHHPLWAYSLWASGFIVLTGAMLKSLYKKRAPELLFGYCTALMLFLSPVGWNYYFPLLFTSIMSLFSYLNARHQRLLLLLLLTIILSSIPLRITGTYYTKEILLSIYSLPFYSLSLLLLNYLIAIKLQKVTGDCRGPTGLAKTGSESTTPRKSLNTVPLTTLLIAGMLSSRFMATEVTQAKHNVAAQHKNYDAIHKTHHRVKRHRQPRFNPESTHHE